MNALTNSIPHLLIVDDERATRESLEEILTLEGFQVALADSGEQALAVLRDTPIDLMLLDLKMKGMDGLQTTETAKQIAPDTVIIMLTAHGTLESAIAAMRRGAFDYLLKPATVSDIIASVQRGLSHRAQMLRQRDLVGLMQRAITELQTPVAQAEAASQPDRYLRARGITLDLQRQNQTSISGALSNLNDADMATEATNQSKRMVLVQSGTAMVAQANTTSQFLLQLLR